MIDRRSMLALMAGSLIAPRVTLAAARQRLLIRGRCLTA
jgi:hypothetical protein